MINYLTKTEYTGINYDALASAGFEDGSAFVTFKQAIKIPGVSGKKLKGIKSVASLVRFTKKEDKNGKEQIVPRYFNVFDAADVLKRSK